MTNKPDNIKVEPDEFYQIPMPIKLRASIRNTCKAFDESGRAFILDKEELSLVYFFEQNCDHLPASQFYDIFSMSEQETINFGGGAAATSTLKRIH